MRTRHAPAAAVSTATGEARAEAAAVGGAVPTEAQRALAAGHCAASDAELRRHLAAAHWVTNHFGMDDLVWNHISARSNEGGILITGGEAVRFSSLYTSRIMFFPMRSYFWAAACNTQSCGI
jgi:hypothetical protein